MAKYYKVNLKDKENNIVYPNISNLINISKDGIIEGTVGIQLKNQGKTWGGAITTSSVIETSDTSNDLYFYPIIRTKTKSNNVVFLGGYKDEYGLHGFFNNSNYNHRDWYFTIDTNNGKLYHSGESSFLGASNFDKSVVFNDEITVEKAINATSSIKLNTPSAEILNSSGYHLIRYDDDSGSSIASVGARTRIRSSRDNLYHYRGDTGADYNIFDAGNYTNYVVPKTGGTFSGNIIAPEFIGMARGKNYSIVINGSSDTYYPVVIKLSGAKYETTRISIWKDLGSQTPNIAGNHSNGTSSMWLIYEGRKMSWDGNGGFIKCLYHSMPYANLCANTYAAGKAIGSLVVLLRGGGCQYNITTTEGSEPKVYYSSTDVGEGYEVIVSPTTSIGNQGLFSSTSLGYGYVMGVGYSGFVLYPANNNEINFGGDSQSQTMYFGYRETDGRPVPTKYYFGGRNNVHADVQAGLLISVKNGNAVTIGSQNASYCHIYNSNDIPFYFNRPVYVNNGYYVVGSVGASVRNLFAGTIANWNSWYSDFALGTVGFCW